MNQVIPLKEIILALLLLPFFIAYIGLLIYLGVKAVKWVTER